MSITIREEHFEQAVLAASSPVLVHFWAPWCGLCRLMTPILNRFQKDCGSYLQIVDINADENLKLANFYKLSTLPTLLFIENGQVLQRFEGLRSRDDFQRALEGLLYQNQLQNSLYD
ncbi:MAG: thioredoxin family protein [Cyanobacteria bacterium P01_G01_bin.38]